MHEAFKSALSVLLVEDDKDLAVFVRQGLEDESCSRRGTRPKTW
jgi:DNA-binding response OmpR family regulator